MCLRLVEEFHSFDTQLRIAQIDPQAGARTIPTSLLSLVDPDDHAKFCNPPYVPFFLMIMAVKALVSFGLVAIHFVGPFEIQFIFFFNLLQYLVDWLFKQ